MSKSNLIKNKLVDGKHNISYFFNAFGIVKPSQYKRETMEKSYSMLLNIALSENDVTLSNMLSWLKDFLRTACEVSTSLEAQIVNSLISSDMEVSYQSLKQIVNTTKERNIQPVRPKPNLQKYKHTSSGSDKSNMVTVIDIQSSPNKYRKYFNYDRLDNIVIVTHDSGLLAVGKSEDITDDMYYFMSQHDLTAKSASEIRGLNRARKEVALRKSIFKCKQYLSQFNMGRGDILLTDKVCIVKIDTRYEVSYRFKGKKYKETFELPLCKDNDIFGLQVGTTFKTLTGEHNLFIVGVLQNEL